MLKNIIHQSGNQTGGRKNMVKYQVGVFVGSLRKDAFSLKMAKALIKLAPESLSLEIIPIGDLPLYNVDLDAEGQMPAAWTGFREVVRNKDAVLFITPEYNRSVPAALKNAIDVGSQPYGKSVWDKKPGAIVSVSPGMIGAFGANHHLRQSLVFLNVPTMQQPEAYVGNAATLFNESGDLTNEKTLSFLQHFMEAYAAWIETILAGQQSTGQ
jgi:chromate reductase